MGSSARALSKKKACSTKVESVGWGAKHKEDFG